MWHSHTYKVLAVEYQWSIPLVACHQVVSAPVATRILYGCFCSKFKVRTIQGVWTLEQLQMNDPLNTEVEKILRTESGNEQ